MRWLGLVGVVVGLLVAGCGPDPIIGKWGMMQQGMELVVEFKADGTAAIDTSGIEARIQQQVAGNPMAKAVGDNLLKNLREAKITWKKEGSVYKTDGTIPGQPSQGPSYLKLDKEQLIPCDQKGTPKGGTAFTRKK